MIFILGQNLLSCNMSHLTVATALFKADDMEAVAAQGNLLKQLANILLFYSAV